MHRNFRTTALKIGVCLLAVFVSLPVQALTLTAAQSRKVHGAAGQYDLPLTLNAAITGAITVESR